MKSSPKITFIVDKTNINKFSNMNQKQQKYVKNYSKNLFDYYADEKKRAVNLFDYYTGNINKEEKMNLMLENGSFATKEDIDKRKEQYAKYVEKSYLWRTVLSFNDNKYLTNNIDVVKLQKIIMTKLMPKFLKKCGFSNIKNISYQSSLHTDTDNLHFHISFIEKKPSCKDGNVYKYRNIYKLPLEAINDFKNSVLHEIEKEKIYTPLVKKMNIELKELETYFDKDDKNFLLNDYNNIKLETDIIKLGKLLSDYKADSNKIKYNSIRDKEIKTLTQAIKKQLCNDPNFKKDYKKFKSTINDINKYFNKVKKENNIKENINNDYINQKLKRYDNYVLNAIVNYSRNIKEEDLLREVVKVKYESYDKKRVLLNSLSNKINSKKYINKYKIEKAIKNIDYELEDSKEKFEDLFKVREYERYD